MKNPFEIEKGVYFNWCSKVDITQIENYIIFDIHQDLKPYLLNLQKDFTTYQVVNVLKLNGIYSPKLYEIFIKKFNEEMHYKKSKKSVILNIEIDKLREMLSIKDTYRYADIKKQIVEVAKKQFKLHTDIQFDYEEQKIGRKVIALEFTIKANKIFVK
jgi:plasmid replication initiation protein